MFKGEGGGMCDKESFEGIAMNRPGSTLLPLRLRFVLRIVKVVLSKIDQKCLLNTEYRSLDHAHLFQLHGQEVWHFFWGHSASFISRISLNHDNIFTCDPGWVFWGVCVVSFTMDDPHINISSVKAILLMSTQRVPWLWFLPVGLNLGRALQSTCPNEGLLCQFRWASKCCDDK